MIKDQFIKICIEVAEIANEFINTEISDFEKYQVVKLENAVSINSSIWNITLKNKDLIPNSPDQAIGAGGEIFIEVNLATGKAKITGYGE